MTTDETLNGLRYEKEKLEKEIKKLKNENDGLYYDIRMLNVKYDELNFEYEFVEYDRNNLYWQYMALKGKCETIDVVVNQYLMNQTGLEELLDSVMLLSSDD